MVTLTNHVIARVGLTLSEGPWHFGNFPNILLPNKVKTKKSLTSERRAPGTVSHGKSGPGSCITFLERFDEGLG